MTILELTPVNQYVGTQPPNLDSSSTPDPFGSVSDNSDTTWTTLSAPFEGDVLVSSLLSVDFQTTSTVTSGSMHMRIRARNSTWLLDNPTTSVYFFARYTDTATDTYVDLESYHYAPAFDNDFQLAPLVGGHVDTARWFDFYFMGEHDVSETPDDTWFRMEPGDPMINALNGDGLRVALYAANVDGTSTLGEYHDLYDIFEVRLILAPDVSGLFPLRRYPPVNNGGSGPTRHYPRTGNRHAGGTY